MAERQAILLVRLDGVGDAALCIPALEGLRRAFSDATFGAVCSPANATLFSDRVQRVHIYDGTVTPSVLGAELAAQRYSKALIATEEVVGYELARRSGAPERAGFWHGWLHKPFKSLWQHGQVTAAVYRPAAWVERPEHEVETMYRLAIALGALPPAPDAAASLAEWLRIEASDASRQAVGAVAFQISPKLLSGGWGPTSLAQLVRTALEQSGHDRAILVCAPADVGLASAILEHMPPGLSESGAIRIVSMRSLPLWLGVVAQVAALVTPDTGAAHVAGMQGVGGVDLFDEDGFERLSQQWHPWAGAWRCLPKPSFRAGSQTSLGKQVGDAVRLMRTT